MPALPRTAVVHAPWARAAAGTHAHGRPERARLACSAEAGTLTPPSRMPFQRLAWRIGLPFVLLVLAETVTLVVYMTTQIAAEERARLETLTSTDATFLRQTGLPANERMARDLQRVTGFAAFFRTRDGLVPEPEDAALGRLLPNLLADGRAHREGDLDASPPQL